MKKEWPSGKKGLALKIGIGVGCLVLVAGVGYYGWQVNYYKDKFFRGTTINHIKCDELNVNQVEEMIRNQVEDYSIQIEFRNGVTEKINGADIDYRYVSDGSVEKLLDDQNPIFWISGLFSEKEYEINKEISYDEKKLGKVIDNLDSLQKDAQQEPEDAYVVFEDEGFVIKDEVNGTKLKENVLKAAVADAVQNSKTSLSAEEKEAYVMPELTKDSELLIRQQKQLNELVKVSVTYKLPNGKKVLDGNTLRKWLDVDEDGNYSLDDEKFEKKIKKYVEKLADKVDTLGKERPFHTTSGLDVTVKGGNYGWKINRKKEIKALTENIKNQEIVTRKPKYSSKELYTENNGLGDTYIEVNLTEQHLYYYQKGKVVMDTDIVSGRMTRDRFTPPGVFFLTYKTKDRILRGAPGPDGQPSYQSHVNFWMPFNGGIGLHDASWRSSYGGTIYKYSGSHGCINLPYNAAKKIYELIDKETPIVCVYNDGYSLHG